MLFRRLFIANRGEVAVRIARACDDLGIQVVAEGIEREEERDAAVELGCDYLQGYLFGRPEAA